MDTKTKFVLPNPKKRRKKMNKGDLINKVAEVLESKKEAQKAVDCVVQAVTDALANNDSVTLVGFGTFKTAERKARKGRNPQTGKEIDIPARNVPKFIPGKALKEAVK
jgi:DNA-binding protein HU-beta